jgi:FkbM family methyltransferase
MKWSTNREPYNEGSFYTLDKYGNIVYRDLQNENVDFNAGEFHNNPRWDSYNYLYFENFQFYGFESRGSDYERFGCKIEQGVSVLDFGANIGAFARYARFRGASNVYCFEPMTPTFHCLYKNSAHDPNIECYKLGVSDKTGIADFKIHTDFTHNGGGSMCDFADKSLDIHHSESCALIGIEEIFKIEKWAKCEFLKIDIEGAERMVCEALPDAALRSLAYISAEFHRNDPEFDLFQKNWLQKCWDFGFKSYVLYYGNGDLRTVTLWKE